ncbi:hypothetical protein Tco_0340977 [Tanacetum coccineum]
MLAFAPYVETLAGRVILFGFISTTIPDTTPVITPPTTQTNTTDPLSDHIPPLPAISPFLSSDDDTTSSDTPDTPPSPTHGTPFTKITSSTQRSPVIPCHRVMILAPRQPIPHGRPYRYHLNGPDHSSSNLPSTSVGLSRKRRRSPMASVPALPPISRALSPVRADLIPSPKRIRSPEIATNLKGCSKDSFEPYIPREVGLGVDVEDESSEQSRSRGTDIEVNDDVKRSDRIDIDPVEAVIKACFDFADMIRASRVDVRIEAILVHRIQVIEGVQREQGHRIVGVESTVTALTERVAELERDNRRLRDTASVESQRVDRL